MSLRERSFSREWLVSAVILITLSVVILVGCGGDKPTTGPNGITREPPAQTKNLTLPDESPSSGGNPVRLRGGEDGLMLVYFGYTSCPDVCPTSMADLRLALAELDQDQRDRLQVSMVTVDPRRDTARVLNGYLGHFFEEGTFHSLRTTDPEQLNKVEKAFGASHELGKPDRDGGYDVSHTALIYAVDENGTVKIEWPFKTDPELIAEDLQTLLAEKKDGTDS